MSFRKVRGVVLLLLVGSGLLLTLTQSASGQDTQALIDQVAQVYGDGGVTSNTGIAGFSWAWLIGGFLFGSIGFIAFVYGKRNTEFRPMLLGIALMVYPYFVRGTVAMYLIGTVFIVVLFVWRE